MTIKKCKAVVYDICTLFPGFLVISFLISLTGCVNRDHDNNDSSLTEKIINISSDHDLLLKKDNQTLIQEANSDIDHGSITPHTIDALSVVINRYYSSPDDKEKRKGATEALSILASIHMSYFIDYTKAYRYLSEARQIAEEDKDYESLSMLYPGIINLYIVNDNEILELQSHVLELFKKGTDYSIKSNNDKSLAAFVVDMALIVSGSTGWGDYEEIVDRIRQYKFDESSAYGRISEKLIDGFDNYFAGNYADAETFFLEAGNEVEYLRFGERFLYPISNFLIHAYEKEGEIGKGINIAKNLLEKAEKENYKDYSLWMNQTLADLYGKIGMTDSASLYHTNYLLLEEEMKKENGYDNIKTLDFLSRIEKISDEVQQLSFKRKEQQQHLTIIVSALIILLIIVSALIITYINLKRNHISLYRRNEEMVKREEQHKLLREQWKKEKDSLQKQLISLKNDEDQESETLDPGRFEKSQENHEEIDQLKSLYVLILDFMESSDEIYKPGFSLNELADLLNFNPRTISRAINVCHKSNFHQLLNEYRIRSATKKMNEPDSEKLTIESIAESVGFKSRTSFASLFKKITGLTPSEYWKMARN